MENTHDPAPRERTHQERAATCAGLVKDIKAELDNLEGFFGCRNFPATAQAHISASRLFLSLSRLLHASHRDEVATATPDAR